MRIQQIRILSTAENINPQSRSFERRICAQIQDLQIFNKSQMNPKEVFHNTAYSVQPPYIAGHSLEEVLNKTNL